MPEWVLVTELADGTPAVCSEWVLQLTFRPIDKVKERGEAPAVFRDRWRAKRVVRLNDAWRDVRIVRREKL